MADTDPPDPRSESERALADLKRNDELGLATPESPEEEGPSVTPETFGERSRGESDSDPVTRESRDDSLPEMP